jgi:hypothetical protein
VIIRDLILCLKNVVILFRMGFDAYFCGGGFDLCCVGFVLYDIYIFPVDHLSAI